MKQVAQEWKKLDAEEKKPYIALAEEAKAAYNAKLEAMTSMLVLSLLRFNSKGKFETHRLTLELKNLGM